MINISTQKATIINVLTPRADRNFVTLNTGEDSIEIRAANTPLVIINADLSEFALAPLSLDYAKPEISDTAILSNLPHEILGALLEEKLGSMLAGLGAAVNSSISVTGYEKCTAASRFQEHLDFTLKIPGASGEIMQPLRLYFKNDSGISIFIAKMKQLPVTEPVLDPEATELSLDILAGTQYLTAGELKSLEPGDTIILDSCYLKDRKVAVQSEIMLCYAILNDGDSSLTVSDEEFVWKNMENYSMAETDAEGIDSLRFRVNFSLGTVTKTLEEIRQLAAGSVIDLGTGDLDSITVRINNQAVARGQLIQVGDHYGVQITDIGTMPDPGTAGNS